MKTSRLIFVVIAGLILALGSTTFAASRQHRGSLAGGDSVWDAGVVSAYVGPYAKVDFIDSGNLVFTGQEYQTQTGSKLFRVETNCYIVGKLEGSKLVSFVDGKFWDLKTEYKVGNSNWQLANPFAVFTYPIGCIGVYDEVVQFRATTGEVSDQHTGTYLGLVKLTVSHP